MRENVSVRFVLSGMLTFFWTVLAMTCASENLRAQDKPEYRAYWAEAFNTQMGTRAEIDRLVDAAVGSNANALFAQVRRRGDSWYLDSKEPLTQVAGVGEPDSSGKPTFDPLKYLIEKARARGVEVHAYIIVGSIYNAHPIVTGTPRDASHVFNQHFWDKTIGAPYADARQWSTRSLPHNTVIDANTSVTFGGQRYGAEWYVDFGHPDAAAYTVDVLTHLVENYDVDGLHLDRIRYPEAPIDRPAGQSMGINVGYNERSVQRFKARYGSQATYYQTSDIGTNVGTAAAPRLIAAADVGYPKTNDTKWNDWRRAQVTDVVRRIYLNATAVKPRIKVSAALICFFTGPTKSGGWEKTEAYYRVFQDWRAWTREGILDIIAPMIYKQEHLFTSNPNTDLRGQFDDWLTFSKQLARDGNRHSMPGLGNYLNGVEGSLLQTRRALARPPFENASGGAAADGVIFYALGSTTPNTLINNSTSAAVTANPFSYPTPNANTPKRTNADFFAALRTGASANGAVRFESPTLSPVFANYAPTPDMPWKSNPTTGYLMGFAKKENNEPLDAATVTITNLDTNQARSTTSDGSGFYGGIGLNPGQYLVKAQLNSQTLYSCVADVAPGAVSSADLKAENVAPTTAAILNPSAPTGANGWFTGDVALDLTATDDCTGVERIEYSIDNGATWLAYTENVRITAEGATTVSYRSIDRAGNVETNGTVVVKIDKTAPTVNITATPSTIRARNGKPVTVQISGAGGDAASGLSSVSYVVADEYGTALDIPTRNLSGSSAGWTDQIAVEASRRGDDRDGRLYRITATITDAAGNTSTAVADVIVLHDSGKSQ